MSISSWLNFDRPTPPGRGSAAGRKLLAPPYYSQRAVFASVWALFSLLPVVAWSMHEINRRRFVFVSSRKEAVFLPANKIAARARYGGCDSLLRPDPLYHVVELMFIIWSVRCIQLFGPRNYRPADPTMRGPEGSRGPFAAGGKEILALGPKTSPGQITHGVFCREGRNLKLRQAGPRYCWRTTTGQRTSLT